MFGIPTLSGSLAALLVAVGTLLPAQAMKVERRAFARVMALRNELLSELTVAEPELRVRVAELLARDVSVHPFDELAEAFAIVRGVECDDALRFRTGLLCMVLPEIVDPGHMAAVHATMHLPRIVDDAGRAEFALELLDAAGDRLDARTIESRTAIEDLLRFRATTSFDVGALDDAPYRITARALLDGVGSRAADPVLDVGFRVLRGFKERALALPMLLDGSPARRERIAAVVSSIPEARRDPVSHAILTGALWQVQRVFDAEPRVPGGDGLADLLRAEAILANLVEDRDALDGLSGPMTIGVPVADAAPGATGSVVAAVRVTIPKDDEPRPLVVFVAGVPAWNTRAHRPASPSTAAPDWLADQLERVGFDADGRFHSVVLESPGRFANAADVLRAATRHLQQILPVRPGRVFWVGEREGGLAVARAVLDVPDAVRGVVLVAGGALTRTDLARLKEVDVLAVQARGHPANVMLARLPRGAVREDQVEVVGPDGVPWPVAVGLNAERIEAFVRARQ